jgi:peptidoglycan/xylan/chitin deacetylase (PgdA/CDA1 family)
MTTELPDRTISFKVDVCTHDGMRDGVPRLLDLFARTRTRASFFLAFGPDRSGKAALNVFRPGFVRKMVRSSAPSLYGWKTMLRGTLLPAIPIAASHPDLVRRMDAEGHEVAVHAWDHRRWQDHVWDMDEREIARHFELAFGAYEAILGRAPRAVGSAAWAVTAASLRVEDALGLDYASDLRGGPACRLRAGGADLTTPQIPTTGRCVEELLTEGIPSEDAIERVLLRDLEDADRAVLAVHAEVEGGPYSELLEHMIDALRERRGEPRTLAEIASGLDREALPLRDLAHVVLEGRSGRVSTSVARSDIDRARSTERKHEAEAAR